MFKKITDEQLIQAVVQYFEDRCEFSYEIAGHLDYRCDVSPEWNNLYVAYMSGKFKLSDCKFMLTFINQL